MRAREGVSPLGVGSPFGPHTDSECLPLMLVRCWSAISKDGLKAAPEPTPAAVGGVDGISRYVPPDGAGVGFKVPRIAP